MEFSQFETSQSKSNLSNYPMRYGFQTNFMTITPTEHDGFSLNKLYIIRDSKA